MVVNPQIASEYLSGGQFFPQQNGIDLPILEIERLDGTALITKEKTDLSGVKYTKCYLSPEGFWRLDSGHMYRLTFEPSVEIPANKCGLVIHRSSLARSGCFIFSGLYDSGFRGQCGAFLHADCNIRIEKGSRLAQLILFEASARESYNGQWQDK